MKKLIFNGGPWDWSKQLGIHRYLFSILSEMDHMVNPGEIELVVIQGNEKKFSFNNIQVVSLRAPTNLILQKILWPFLIFPKYVRKHRGLGVDAILALPIWGCDVFVLYDCIRELFQANRATILGKFAYFYYIFKAKICVRHAKQIVTDSYDAQKDISRIYHLDPKNIEVVYSGWQHFNMIQEETAVLDRLQLRDKKFFFTLGSQAPHKNIKWIIKAAEQNPQYTFIITGQALSSVKEDYYNHPENIVFTGYLQDGEVKTLMRNCTAFILPSLYEGFGLPPLEAMSVGARCIVSNTTSLPEIYKKSVWYIDPCQYENIDIDQIMRAEIEPNEEVLQLYSWENSARKMLNILHKLR